MCAIDKGLSAPCRLIHQSSGEFSNEWAGLYYACIDRSIIMIAGSEMEAICIHVLPGSWRGDDEGAPAIPQAWRRNCASGKCRERVPCLLAAHHAALPRSCQSHTILTGWTKYWSPAQTIWGTAGSQEQKRKWALFELRFVCSWLSRPLACRLMQEIILIYYGLLWPSCSLDAIFLKFNLHHCSGMHCLWESLFKKVSCNNGLIWVCMQEHESMHMLHIVEKASMWLIQMTVPGQLLINAPCFVPEDVCGAHRIPAPLLHGSCGLLWDDARDNTSQSNSSAVRHANKILLSPKRLCFRVWGTVPGIQAKNYKSGYQHLQASRGMHHSQELLYTSWTQLEHCLEARCHWMTAAKIRHGKFIP